MAHVEVGTSLWVPVILLGSFVVDATLTLLRRMARRERWYEAHRTHAYQHLSRRLGSHRPVTIGYSLVNLAWLLPLAIVATLRSDVAWFCTVVAYSPLIVAALLVGAGRPETRRAGR
jgi:Fuc2NAc and GlcNAc transferase